MGTDIHLAAERRDPTTGKWHRVPPTQKLQDSARDDLARWLDPASKDAEMREWAERKVEWNWYDDRNYETFAILASVRNGTAFAGVLTGEGFRPIDVPRGLPHDLSAELRTPANYEMMRESGFDNVPLDPPEDPLDGDERGFWLGYHDASYFTVKELQAYDWTQQTYLCGVIDWKAYKERIGTSKADSPHTYSGSVSCKDCVTLDERLDNPRAVAEDNTALLAVAPAALSLEHAQAWADRALHVRVWWRETYAESAGRFYTDVLPELASVDPDPNNVRIVFGFDS